VLEAVVSFTLHITEYKQEHPLLFSLILLLTLLYNNYKEVPVHSYVPTYIHSCINV
jgi:hypothetical protein